MFLAIVLGIATRFVANRRGRNAAAWGIGAFLPSLFVPFIGVILIAAVAIRRGAGSYPSADVPLDAGQQSAWSPELTSPVLPAPPSSPNPAPSPVSPVAPRPAAPRPAAPEAVSRPDGASAARTLSTGDAILKGLSTITLNSWTMKKMAAAFEIPDLAAAVTRRPRESAPRLHLGLRLQEMERLSDRINRSVAPGSGTALLLRPVTRRVTRAGVRALRSDNTKASDKALESAFQAAMAELQKDPRRVESLDVLARTYQLKGDLAQAVKVASASVELDASRPDPYFIAAECCVDAGQVEAAQAWAQRAVERGSTLAPLLFDARRADLRREFTSTKANMLNMPSTYKYWKKKAEYFAPADKREVARFYGTSPVTAGQVGA